MQRRREERVVVFLFKCLFFCFLFVLNAWSSSAPSFFPRVSLHGQTAFLRITVLCYVRDYKIIFYRTFCLKLFHCRCRIMQGQRLCSRNVGQNREGCGLVGYLHNVVHLMLSHTHSAIRGSFRNPHLFPIQETTQHLSHL